MKGVLESHFSFLVCGLLQYSKHVMGVVYMKACYIYDILLHKLQETLLRTQSARCNLLTKTTQLKRYLVHRMRMAWPGPVLNYTSTAGYMFAVYVVSTLLHRYMFGTVTHVITHHQRENRN